MCVLTEFLLDTVTVDSYSDTPSEHLPSLFLHLVSALCDHCSALSSAQTALALSLCTKILTRVQPTIVTSSDHATNVVAKETSVVAKDVSTVAKETNVVAKESRSRLDTGNESMRSGEMNSLISTASGSVFNSETSIDR